MFLGVLVVRRIGHFDSLLLTGCRGMFLNCKFMIASWGVCKTVSELLCTSPAGCGFLPQLRYRLPQTRSAHKPARHSSSGTARTIRWSRRLSLSLRDRELCSRRAECRVPPTPVPPASASYQMLLPAPKLRDR